MNHNWRNKRHRSDREIPRGFQKKFLIQIPAAGAVSKTRWDERSRSSSKARYKSGRILRFRVSVAVCFLSLSLSSFFSSPALGLSPMSVFFYPLHDGSTCSPTRNYEPSWKNFRLPPLLPSSVITRRSTRKGTHEMKTGPSFDRVPIASLYTAFHDFLDFSSPTSEIDRRRRRHRCQINCYFVRYEGRAVIFSDEGNDRKAVCMCWETAGVSAHVNLETVIRLITIKPTTFVRRQEFELLQVWHTKDEIFGRFQQLAKIQF